MKKVVLGLAMILAVSISYANGTDKIKRIKKSIERSEVKVQNNRNSGWIWNYKTREHSEVRTVNKQRRLDNKIAYKNVKLQVAILESNIVKVSRIKR